MRRGEYYSCTEGGGRVRWRVGGEMGRITAALGRRVKKGTLYKL